MDSLILPQTEEARRCIACSETKPISCFYPSGNMLDEQGKPRYFRNKCKTCTNKKEKRTPHRKKRIECPEGFGYCSGCDSYKATDLFSKNRNTKSGLSNYCRECNKRYWKNPTEQSMDKHRRRVRKHKYGLSPEKYQEMLESQHGVCALCGKPETVIHNVTPKPLSVDHDHETGKVRELLCHHCNTGLGYFKDDVELMQRAIEYLKRHQ